MDIIFKYICFQTAEPKNHWKMPNKTRKKAKAFRTSCGKEKETVIGTHMRIYIGRLIAIGYS